MVKAFRVLKVLANIAVFGVLAYLIAGLVSELFVFVAELNIDPENIYLYNDKFIPTQVEYFAGLVLDIVDFVASIGSVGLFVIFFLLYCYKMNQNTIGLDGRAINNVLFGKISALGYRVIGFHKSKGYWVICFFTSFIPYFVPLFISWAIRLFAFALKLVCGPVLLFISQIKYALKGSVA